MGWKDLLFEQDPKAPIKEPPAPTTGPVFGGGPPPVFGSAPTWQPAPAAPPALVSEIDQRLSQRNPPAYLQFVTLMESLARAVPDERMRYAAALATSRLSQSSPQAILDAFDSRIRIVDDLAKQFEIESQSAVQAQTAPMQADLDRARTELLSTETELNRLVAKQAQLKTTVDAQAVAIENVRRAVADTASGMQLAFTAVRSRVTAERDNVARNISGVSA